MSTETAAPTAQPATPTPAVVQPAPVTPPATPVVAAPPVAPVAAAPVVAPAPDAPPQTDPAWLNPRLEQAKRAAQAALLAELGVEDPAAAKALLAAAKAAEEAQKTELQKARDEAAALKPKAARAAQLEQTIKSRADIELAGLTEAQRAAVTAVAGDDSAKVLSTIDALKPTWVSAAPAPVATPAPAPAAQPAPPAAAPPAAPAIPAPPANTSPAPTAPTSGNVSPPDRKAEYQALKVKNPIAAAAYLNAYASEIYPRA